jgi:fido (protein-threonine AMPylation protein)
MTMPEKKADQEIHGRNYASEFDEYVRHGEPEKKEKGYVWRTAIGMQAVDNLAPSEYLIRTAKENIEGIITFEEVKDRLDSYYQAKPVKEDTGDRTEEADKVSARIAEILSEKTFTFSPAEYSRIHYRLFAGIYKFAGEIRDHNISKAEWVLSGKTVLYASADSIRATLDYDFDRERAFNYRGLSETQAVEHIAKFISNIWQIHAFGEGNTRTTAVFAIKYLRFFGFSVENDTFAEHSWYFRNALVRANYNDLKNNIYATQEYLDRFFANLLFDRKHRLINRELFVGKNPIPLASELSGGETFYDTLNDTLKFIAANPKATQEEIATGIGKSTATVKRATAELGRLGRLERMNGKRDGYWQLK